MLRKNGDPRVRERVQDALRNGEACWCPMIRLELWNGAGGERERRVLREFERVLPELEIGAAVWATAYELSRQARAAGVTIPATDLLIASCARHHDVDLETADCDFAKLEAL